MAGIKARIALEGGKEVEKALEDVGKTGKKAFDDLQKSAANTDFQKVGDDLKKTGEAGQQAGKQISESLQEAEVTVRGFSNTLVDLAFKFSVIATAAGQAVTALKAVSSAFSGIVTAASEAGDAVQKSAEKLGTTTKGYQDLIVAATKAGVAQEDAAKGFDKFGGIIESGKGKLEEAAKQFDPLNTGIRVFRGGVDTAGEAAKKAFSVFDQFGIAVTGANGKLLESTAILDNVAEKLQKLGEGREQTKIAEALGLKDLLPLLNEGKDGLNKFLAAAQETGRALNSDDLKVSKGLTESITGFETSLADLRSSLAATRTKLLLLFAPGQTKSNEFLSGALDQITKFVDATRPATVELAKFGLEIQKLAQTNIAKWFEDNGGAVGVFKTAVVGILEFLADLSRVITSLVIPAFGALKAGIQVVANTINSIFGTNVSAQFVVIAGAIALMTGAFSLARGAIGGVLSIFAVLGSAIAAIPALFLAAGVAAAAFWGSLRTGGTAALGALQRLLPQFSAALSQLFKGDFAGAWATFAAAARTAIADVNAALKGSALSDFIASIGRAVAVIRAVLSGLAAAINSVFGTKLSAGSLALLLVLAQIGGVFTALGPIVLLATHLFTALGIAFLAVASAAIILARLFPDLGKTLEAIGSAITNLLKGDFKKSLDDLTSAFAGFFANLQKEGLGTWAILGVGAAIFFRAVLGVVATIALLPIAFAGATLLILRNLESIKEFFGKIFTGDFAGAFKQLVDAFKWDEIKKGGDAAWAAILASFIAMVLAIRAAMLGINAGWALIQTAASLAFAGIVVSARAAAIAIAAFFSPGGLIALAVVALGALIVIFWDDVAKLGIAAANKIAEAARNAGEELRKQAGSKLEDLTPVPEGGAVAKWREFTSFISRLLSDLGESAAALGRRLNKEITTDDLRAGWTSLKAFLSGIFDDIGAAFASLGRRLIDEFQAVPTQLREGWEAFKTWLFGIFDEIVSRAKTAGADIIKAINPLSAGKDLFKAIAQEGSENAAKVAKDQGKSASDSVSAWQVFLDTAKRIWQEFGITSAQGAEVAKTNIAGSAEAAKASIDQIAAANAAAVAPTKSIGDQFRDFIKALIDLKPAADAAGESTSNSVGKIADGFAKVNVFRGGQVKQELIVAAEGAQALAKGLDDAALTAEKAATALTQINVFNGGKLASTISVPNEALRSLAAEAVKAGAELANLAPGLSEGALQANIDAIVASVTKLKDEAAAIKPIKPQVDKQALQDASTEIGRIGEQLASVTEALDKLPRTAGVNIEQVVAGGDQALQRLRERLDNFKVPEVGGDMFRRLLTESNSVIDEIQARLDKLKPPDLAKSVSAEGAGEAGTKAGTEFENKLQAEVDKPIKFPPISPAEPPPHPFKALEDAAQQSGGDSATEFQQKFNDDINRVLFDASPTAFQPLTDAAGQKGTESGTIFNEKLTESIAKPFEAAPLFSELPTAAGEAGARAGTAFWENWRTSTNVEDRRGQDGSFIALEDAARQAGEKILDTFILLRQEIGRIFSTEIESPFQGLTEQALAAFERIKTEALTVGQSIRDALSGGGGAAAATAEGAASVADPFAAIRQSLESLKTFVVGSVAAINDELEKIGQTGGGVAAAPAEGEAPAAADPSGLFGLIKSGLEEIKTLATGTAQEINTAFDAINFTGLEAHIAGLSPAIQQMAASLGAIDFSGLVAGLDAVLQRLEQSFRDIVQTIAGLFQNDLTAAVQASMAGIQEAVTAMVAAVQTQLRELANTIKEVGSAAASSGSGGGGGGGGDIPDNAAGGLFRGKGTGRSDSNLSWISNGEYIVNAFQTRRWLPILEAINHGSFNMRALARRISRFSVPKFADGGLLNLGGLSLPSFPKFADGGLASSVSSTPINLVLPNGQVVTGLHAAPDAVEVLQRATRNAALSSAQRRPSWDS